MRKLPSACVKQKSLALFPNWSEISQTKYNTTKSKKVVAKGNKKKCLKAF